MSKTDKLSQIKVGNDNEESGVSIMKQPVQESPCTKNLTDVLIKVPPESGKKKAHIKTCVGVAINLKRYSTLVETDSEFVRPVESVQMKDVILTHVEGYSLSLNIKTARIANPTLSATVINAAKCSFSEPFDESFDYKTARFVTRSVEKAILRVAHIRNPEIENGFNLSKEEQGNLLSEVYDDLRKKLTDKSAPPTKKSKNE